MQVLTRICAALCLLSVLSACAVQPVPRDKAAAFRTIAVVSAFSDTRAIRFRGFTVFQNRSAVEQPTWSHNEIALSFLSERLPRNYELIEAVAVRTGESAEPGATPAAIARRALAGQTVDAIIVLTETRYDTEYMGPLPGIGLWRATNLVGSWTTAAYSAFKIDVLDGTTFNVLASSLASPNREFGDPEISIGVLMTSAKRTDHVGPFEWRKNFKEYSPESLQTIETAVRRIIEACLRDTLTKMNIRLD